MKRQAETSECCTTQKKARGGPSVFCVAKSEAMASTVTRDLFQLMRWRCLAKNRCVVRSAMRDEYGVLSSHAGGGGEKDVKPQLICSFTSFARTNMQVQAFSSSSESDRNHVRSYCSLSSLPCDEVRACLHEYMWRRHDRLQDTFQQRQ